MTQAAVATHDGVIRNPQARPEDLRGGPWDGRRHPYVPPAELRIDPALELHEEFERDIDPVTYQVLRSRFWHKNLEHGDIIRRISGSFVVVYANDFATSLLTETGDVITVSPTIQYFSALSDLVVKWTLEHRSADGGIADGDIFLQNDPYVGTAHQADTAVYAPVFWDGKLFCWVYNCCHIGDLGGVDPGGFAVHARDIYDESVVVPPIRVVRSDELLPEVVEMFSRQSREPERIELGLRSQVAGVRAMRRHMLEIVEQYGPAVVKGVMRKAIADCSRIVGKRLRQIPDGTWRERLYVCGATGDDRTSHVESLTLTKRGDRLRCSNAGTSPQGGPGNSSYGLLRSSIVAAVGSALAHDQLGCTAGVGDHIEFEPVPGTRNVACHPAACGAILSTMTTVNIAGLVTSKMLLSAPPELRAHASGSGGLAVPLNDLVFGVDEQGNFLGHAGSGGSARLAGCIGASPLRDGIGSGNAWWLLGTTAGNVEEGEQAGVALVLYRKETTDSGGPGRWRGGNGATSAYVPHKVETVHAQLTFIDPGTNTAAGLAGGYYGLAGNYLRAGNDAVGESIAHGRLPGSRAEIEEITGGLQRLHPRARIAPIPHGDCIVIECNGAGGFGDPLERDPELVRSDVEDERVSVRAARAHWGVELRADGSVDAAATTRRREQLRAARARAAGSIDGRPQRLAGAEVVVAGAAGSVDLVSYDGGTAWACSSCGHALGAANENFKRAALQVEHRPDTVDPHMYPDPGQYGDGQTVLRQYLCPGCFALLAQEFCRPGDEPLFDFQLVEPGDRDG